MTTDASPDPGPVEVAAATAVQAVVEPAWWGTHLREVRWQAELARREERVGPTRAESGRELNSEVAAERDALWPHHRRCVLDVLDDALDRRRLADREGDEHHAEHAATLRERPQLVVAQVPRNVVHGAAAGFEERECHFKAEPAVAARHERDAIR